MLASSSAVDARVFCCAPATTTGMIAAKHIRRHRYFIDLFVIISVELVAKFAPVKRAYWRPSARLLFFGPGDHPMRIAHKSLDAGRARMVAGFILLAAAVACTQPTGGPDISLPDGAGTAVPQTATLVAISVALSATTANIGQSATATASGRDQFGKPFAPGVVTWSTVPAELASVNSDGVVTLLSEGTVTVWASKAGITPGSASIVISK
jgi:hypothetical protein